jgi:hypothetical protein
LPELGIPGIFDSIKHGPPIGRPEVLELHGQIFCVCTPLISMNGRTVSEHFRPS